MNHRSETGASLVEYVMLLAFVAVIGLVGVRAVGAAVPGLFDSSRLGFAPTTSTTVRTEVLGATLTRFDRPCRPMAGAEAHPTCPE